jgi:hypothetical protein
MARSTQPRTIDENVRRVFTVGCKADSMKAASDHQRSAYADEIALYENSRSFRATNALMRSNRAPFFS